MLDHIYRAYVTSILAVFQDLTESKTRRRHLAGWLTTAEQTEGFRPGTAFINRLEETLNPHPLWWCRNCMTA
jgi:hypothetical protein